MVMIVCKHTIKTYTLLFCNLKLIYSVNMVSKLKYYFNPNNTKITAYIIKKSELYNKKLFTFIKNTRSKTVYFKVVFSTNNLP